VPIRHRVDTDWTATAKCQAFLGTVETLVDDPKTSRDAQLRSLTPVMATLIRQAASSPFRSQPLIYSRLALIQWWLPRVSYALGLTSQLHSLNDVGYESTARTEASLSWNAHCVCYWRRHFLRDVYVRRGLADTERRHVKTA
jgi:hypothetical protein